MSPLIIMLMRKQMQRHKLPDGTYPPGYGWGLWLIAGFVLLSLVAEVVLISLYRR